ncbi:MAG: cytochrome ubiquinol oxidase subunit I [Candidatus Omnitrophica bacterium]|nr:cytochrome ubiquinol oxidase subunit I [Candidatus Omnitrophota bacterium]
MNYPAWDVPHIGSGWVIGSIAIFHVMISHFAVGGGLYLPMAESRALKKGRKDWLEFLPNHAKFFLILTGVYGAVSGVGIWFAIGLASPEGTSTLIHNFVFGWAIEWVFFIIELSTAAVYYYTWNRIPERLHLKVGWLYAGASFFTLFIINGILTFMLTPGAAWLEVAGSGQEASRFFQAFFNPTYWPSLFLRTLVCVSLAGLWALVTASRLDGNKQGALKTEVIRWSFGWLLPAFFLMPICFLWYLYQVPESQSQLLGLGISTIGSGTFTQVTRTALITVMTSATILCIAYFVAYRNPREFGFGYAVCLLVLGLAATGSTEKAREMLRKPYVVGEHMYSNGIRKTPVGEPHITEVEKFNSEGYLTQSLWATEEERVAWAEFDHAWNGGVQLASETLGPQVAPETLRRGELMFQGQCLACHTRDAYRSMKNFLRDRDLTSIRNMLGMLHDYKEDSPYRAFMPPLVGTETEREALALYLNEMAHGGEQAQPAEPVHQVARTNN